MDIIAESLSAKVLKSKEVLVNGKDILDYFTSKLSAAVQFYGVFDSIAAAEAAGAKKNGAIIIVDTKEYIWSDNENKWIEIGDESVVGQLATDVGILSGKVNTLAEVSSVYTLTADAGSMAYENKNNYQVAGNYLSSNALEGYLTKTSADNDYQPKGSYLTAHQSLSDYYQKSETSSSAQLQALQNATGI